MLTAFMRQFGLRTQAALGLDGSVLALSLIGAVAGLAALAFATVAAFIWLAAHTDTATAGLVLAAAYLSVSVTSLTVCMAHHRRLTKRAQAALAANDDGGLPFRIDPQLLLIALELGRSVGVRRLLPIAAIGFLAALGSREWFGQSGGSQARRT